MNFYLGDERIQNMVKKEIKFEKKPARYVSIFKPQVQCEYKKSKKQHRTMGYAQEKLPDPTSFLKRKSGSALGISGKSTTPVQKCSRCLLTDKRPPLPKIQSASCQDRGRQLSRNHQRDNIRRVVQSAPPRTTPKYVDSRTGTVFKVEDSGLHPKYIFKKNFGKLPAKTDLHKQNTGKDSKELEKISLETLENEFKNCVKLSDTERLEILEGLKKRLTEKNKEFLLLPVIIDSPYLINYQRRIEKEILQLEKDICIIESNPVIYVDS